jgi:hypothetical protein
VALGTIIGMEIDRNGLEVLDRATCLALLAQGVIGRVGVTSRALPTVLPVNYGLVGDRIVMRTGRGTKLDAATRNAVVAFEVDEFDRDEGTGWSVVVTGVAREMDPSEVVPAELVPVPLWMSGGADHLVAISTDVISGRRVLASPPMRMAMQPSIEHRDRTKISGGAE